MTRNPKKQEIQKNKKFSKNSKVDKKFLKIKKNHGIFFKGKKIL